MPSNLSNWKSKVDKLDIGKLETASVDLGKLSNVRKYNIAKKTEHNELVTEFKNFSTTDASNLDKKPTITQRLMNFK